ncbi:MAG: amidase [SAR202 cluster bacterium]|nr:amidase [SAR202 cluster bacterium]
MSDELVWLSAAGLAHGIRTKRFTPVEVVEAHLRRIEAVNPKVNAVVTMVDGAVDAARKAGQAVMRGRRLGPLHGVPFTIKDSFNTAGVRTTGGSRLFKDNVPRADATVVARLKRAGGVFIAKTNMPEFAMDAETSNVLFGRTCNPWNRDRSTNGSSGGEAAAIACGMSPLGIGSDVAGSIRAPAAYCNILGLKATHGRIPLTGHWPEVLHRYMHVGPMARTAADIDLALSILAGPDGVDLYAAPLKYKRVDLARPLEKLRIGWSAENGYKPVAKEVQRTVGRAASALADAGCVVEPARMDWLDRRDYQAEFFDVLASEVAGVARPMVAGRESELAPNMTRFLTWPMPSFERYLAAINGFQELRNDTAAFFQKYDVMLGPTSPVLPHPYGEAEHSVDGLKVPRYHVSKNTAPWDATGSPALSVPFGWSSDGLPIGVQLVGRHFDEATLLRVAAALETAAEKPGRTPPVW